MTNTTFSQPNLTQPVYTPPATQQAVTAPQLWQTIKQSYGKLAVLAQKYLRYEWLLPFAILGFLVMLVWLIKKFTK